jgi:hypothetical protein
VELVVDPPLEVGKVLVTGLQHLMVLKDGPKVLDVPAPGLVLVQSVVGEGSGAVSEGPKECLNLVRSFPSDYALGAIGCAQGVDEMCEARGGVRVEERSLKVFAEAATCAYVAAVGSALLVARRAIEVLADTRTISTHRLVADVQPAGQEAVKSAAGAVTVEAGCFVVAGIADAAICPCCCRAPHLAVTASALH